MYLNKYKMISMVIFSIELQLVDTYKKKLKKKQESRYY